VFGSGKRELHIVIKGDSSDARREMDRLSGHTTKTHGFIASSGRKLAMVGKVGALAVAAGVAMSAKVGFDMHQTLVQAERAMTNFMGSADKAKAHIENLKVFAAETPFEMKGLLQANQMLMASGFEAKKVIPVLTILGDAAAGVGLGTDGVMRVTRAISQMNAKAKLSGEEMRQLTEAGVPAWKMLAEAVGMSVAETQEAARKGEIDFQTGMDALLTGMQKSYGGMMKDFSTTTAGRLSTVKDNFQFAMAEIVSGFDPVINKGAEWINQIADQWMPKISGFGKSIKHLMEGLFSGKKTKGNPFGELGETFAGLYKKVAPSLEKMGDTFRTIWHQQIVPFAKKMVPLFREIGQKLGPIMKDIGDILGVVFKWLAEQWEKFGPGITRALMVTFEVVYRVIGKIVEILGGLIEFIAGVFTGDWNKAWNGIVRMWNGLWEGIGEIVSGAFRLIKVVMANSCAWLVDMFLGFVDAFIGASERAFGWIPGVGDKLRESRKRFNEWRDGVVKDIRDTARGAHENPITPQIRTQEALRKNRELLADAKEKMRQAKAEYKINPSVDNARALQQAENLVERLNAKIARLKDEQVWINYGMTRQGVLNKLRVGPAMSRGGHVEGPGTETSDDIPVNLSKHEYVIRAKSARRLGRDVLDYLNRHGELPLNRAAGGPVVRTKAAWDMGQFEIVRLAAIKARQQLAEQGRRLLEQALARHIERQERARQARQADRLGRIAAGGRRPVPYPVTTGYGVPGPMWSSGYHTGVDFAAPGGTPIRAWGAGNVTAAGWAGAYGIMARIKHLVGGLETLYAHMSRIFVSVGRAVKQGSVIGQVGTTGNSSGNHLHFEAFRNGVRINPMSILDKGGWLPPGLSTVFNGTGKPERVLGPQEAVQVNVYVNVRGSVMAEKDLADAIAPAVRDALVRNRKRNGGRWNLGE
jgi:tape measure domain-containing protein